MGGPGVSLVALGFLLGVALLQINAKSTSIHDANVLRHVASKRSRPVAFSPKENVAHDEGSLHRIVRASGDDATSPAKRKKQGEEEPVKDGEIEKKRKRQHSTDAQQEGRPAGKPRDPKRNQEGGGQSDRGPPKMKKGDKRTKKQEEETENGKRPSKGPQKMKKGDKRTKKQEEETENGKRPAKDSKKKLKKEKKDGDRNKENGNGNRNNKKTNQQTKPGNGNEKKNGNSPRKDRKKMSKKGPKGMKKGNGKDTNEDKPRKPGQKPTKQGQKPRKPGQKPRKPGQKPRKQGQKPRKPGQKPMKKSQKPTVRNKGDGEIRQDSCKERKKCTKAGGKCQTEECVNSVINGCGKRSGCTCCLEDNKCLDAYAKELCTRKGGKAVLIEECDGRSKENLAYGSQCTCCIPCEAKKSCTRRGGECKKECKTGEVNGGKCKGKDCKCCLKKSDNKCTESDGKPKCAKKGGTITSVEDCKTTQRSKWSLDPACTCCLSCKTSKGCSKKGGVCASKCNNGAIPKGKCPGGDCQCCAQDDGCSSSYAKKKCNSKGGTITDKNSCSSISKDKWSWNPSCTCCLPCAETKGCTDKGGVCAATCANGEVPNAKCKGSGCKCCATDTDPTAPPDPTLKESVDDLVDELEGLANDAAGGGGRHKRADPGPSRAKRQAVFFTFIIKILRRIGEWLIDITRLTVANIPEIQGMIVEIKTLRVQVVQQEVVLTSSQISEVKKTTKLGVTLRGEIVQQEAAAAKEAKLQETKTVVSQIQTSITSISSQLSSIASGSGGAGAGSADGIAALAAIKEIMASFTASGVVAMTTEKVEQLSKLQATLESAQSDFSATEIEEVSATLTAVAEAETAVNAASEAIVAKEAAQKEIGLLEQLLTATTVIEQSVTDLFVAMASVTSTEIIETTAITEMITLIQNFQVQAFTEEDVSAIKSFEGKAVELIEQLEAGTGVLVGLDTLQTAVGELSLTASTALEEMTSNQAINENVEILSNVETLVETIIEKTEILKESTTGTDTAGEETILLIIEFLKSFSIASVTVETETQLTEFVTSMTSLVEEGTGALAVWMHYYWNLTK
ncbi:uncharacterized protein LOC125046640 [Penaeus chinensis]|uniref:uncharacterized protein LOC125046640 n=1 Tax=Penaeus chinensis TaxID=139456 RepID=UPI001FB678BA|nr:uncharacterized protein LOC125046640 [Penaeus chinensis]